MRVIVDQHINNEKVQQIKKLCEFTLAEAMIILNFSKDIKIIISNMKKKSFRGYFHIGNNKIMINGNQNLHSILDTLCHELIHAEQNFRGSLNIKKDVIYWEDQKYPLSYLRDMKVYDKLPWEIEANERGKNLTSMIFDKICKGYV